MRLIKTMCAILLITAMLLCVFPVSAFSDYEHSEHQDLALEAVGEGIVLLKNDDQALPLSENESVALFGNGQIYVGSTTAGYQIGGGGSGRITSMLGTPLDPAGALLEAEKEGKISVFKQLTDAYKSNINYVPDATMYDTAAASCDTAIMFITRYSSESSDIKVDSWYLTAAEKTMLQTLSEKFEKLVVILNTPGPISTEWSLDGNSLGVDVDALVSCYLAGEKGGEGLAKILLGEVNPSGKLPHTYAKDIYDYPTTDTFLESNDYVNYEEDIYVGYRYFETFAKDKVAYPFGYGLSYTDFDMTAGETKVANGKITVSVTVKNVGTSAGKEVVQVYYSAPQAGTGSAVLSKSAVSLAAYAKTKLLAPNESETLTLSFAITDMASFDDVGKTGHDACYVLEAGAYGIYVGNSVRNTAKVYTYNLTSLTVVSEHEHYLATTLEKRLTADGGYEALPENSGASLSVFGSQVTWIEAEDGTLPTGTSIKISENYAGQGFLYDGSKWVALPGSSYVLGNMQRIENKVVTYSLKVEQAGTYRVGFVIANGTDKKTNGVLRDVEEVFEMYVSTDGTLGQKQQVALGVENTRNANTGYYWFNFKFQTETKDGTVYTVELPKGEVTLSLSIGYTDTAPNIDKFVLIPEGVAYTVEDVLAYYEESALEFDSATVELDADQYQGITYADVKAGKATLDELIAQMSYNELIELCYGHASGIVTETGTMGFALNETAEKYGIYSADTADGPAGLRTDELASVSTWWPCSTLQAAMWNVELIEEIGRAVGAECIRYNADIWLAPGMNIHRNPLCGRNFEYYSEDPLVSGKSAAALVKGAQSMGVACSIKHLALNNKETNRKKSDSRVSEKALREIYLKGFEIAVKEADPKLIMNSYNMINGVYASANSDLLRGIVRGEWGYEGLITSDWISTPDNLDEILAGTNIKMPLKSGQPDQLKAAVKNGELTRELLEENAAYIINTLVTLPDHTLHAICVNEIAENTATTIVADQYSKRAYTVQFEMVGDTLSACYMTEKDESGAYGFIEFTLSVKKAGEYSLVLEYATNASTRIQNAFELSVNGDVSEAIDNDLDSSGAYSQYKKKEIGTVYLDEGLSTLRIQHTSGTAANYHAITFEAASEHTHSFGAWTSADETQHKQTCSCGEQVFDDHKWNEGVLSSDGMNVYTCTECQATKTEPASSDQGDHISGTDTPTTTPDTPAEPSDDGNAWVWALLVGGGAIAVSGVTVIVVLGARKKKKR